MSLKNPIHPGRIVKLDVIAPLDLTITAAARRAQKTIKVKRYHAPSAKAEAANA